MREMKYKKISDENNVLGFDEIILLESRISTVRKREGIYEHEEAVYCYLYEFVAICDGELMYVNESDWAETQQAYELQPQGEK